MKKVLLSSAALVALAVSPAMAQDQSGVKLDLSGFFKGYGVYVSQDEAVGSDARNIDILRQTEVHFSGETTLDNGLTVGAHIEGRADQGESFDIDESYAYFSGSWGRVNFGAEDGANFLLQVAAPSADSNIDGIRQYLNPVNYSLSSDATMTGLAASIAAAGIDYDNDASLKSDKLTYLTPVFSGFQAGVSYTPDVMATAAPFASAASRSLGGVTTDDVSDVFGSAWDLGVRYEGQFESFDLNAGAGYTTVDLESDGLTGEDDFQEWNIGADVNIGAFGLGAVYTENNGGVDDNGDSDTWVLGADYTTGPFVLGVSYLNNDLEVGATTDVDTDRYTGGVTYAYGPGMTFRGSVSYIDHEVDYAAATDHDEDATSVMLGTQINF